MNNSSTTYPTFDPTDDDYIQNPYPYYEQLRNHHPISWVQNSVHKGWMVTGYKEAITILTDQRFQSFTPTPQKILARLQKEMVLFKNQPNHQPSRMMLNRVFTNNMVHHFIPYIEKTTTELLKNASTKQTIDVIQDFAFPLPSLVITEMLGIPLSDRETFRHWSNTLIQTIDLTRDDAVLEEGKQIVFQLMKYFKYLIKERQEHPEEDLISQFIREGMGERELLSTCILLLIAGQETTVNLISNGIYTLFQHPEDLQKLKENKALIESAVEEILRYESPTQMIVRKAAVDCNVANVPIKKDHHLYISLGACNRDPNIFEQPSVFNISRQPNAHLAFGISNHFCLGATLARLEAKIAIEQFLTQFPNFQLAEENVQWRHLSGFRALSKLPLML
ncbi:MAG TPA: cytochrome P450 [Massilibacterium sp.]|nr:cytochrome P450 [Massilibacterium sp.]